MFHIFHIFYLNQMLTLIYMNGLLYVFPERGFPYVPYYTHFCSLYILPFEIFLWICIHVMKSVYLYFAKIILEIIKI